MKKLSNIGAARADVASLRETLRSLIDAVQREHPSQTGSLRKELIFAEVILKETDRAD